MKKTCAVILLTLAGVLALVQLPAAAAASDKQPTTRTLTGMVQNHAGAPLPNAIVYLTDTRTKAVKTFIVGNDGTYRFPALSPNVDYEVYAIYDNKKSDTKTLSSFDSRPQAVINLKIDVK